MKKTYIIITLLSFAIPLYAAAEGDTTSPDRWEHPWGEQAGKKYMRDLVQKKSQERIRCTIEKDDSLNLYVNVKKIGGGDNSFSIPKADVYFYEYDYFQVDTSVASLTLNAEEKAPNAIMTIGFLQAGGLFGADMEIALADHLGLQVGLGLVGADVSLNYHFGKSLNSSSIGLEARGQFLFLINSVGAGPVFTYRLDGSTCQIGYNLYCEGGTMSLAGPGSSKPNAFQRIIISFGGYFTLW
ncbi:MAG: hypothetical protein ACM3U1_07690 [Chloroflexota bacterium]